ncbi:MAG: hypothetical protein AcusKO_12980 [Acuticoccus sp.]
MLAKWWKKAPFVTPAAAHSAATDVAAKPCRRITDNAASSSFRRASGAGGAEAWVMFTTYQPVGMLVNTISAQRPQAQIPTLPEKGPHLVRWCLGEAFRACCGRERQHRTPSPVPPRAGGECLRTGGSILTSYRWYAGAVRKAKSQPGCGIGRRRAEWNGSCLMLPGERTLPVDLKELYGAAAPAEALDCRRPRDEPPQRQ